MQISDMEFRLRIPPITRCLSAGDLLHVGDSPQAELLESDLSGASNRLSAEQATGRLEELIGRYQALGYKVHMEKRSDGSIVIGIVRPSLEGEAKHAIDALPERISSSSRPVGAK